MLVRIAARSGLIYEMKRKSAPTVVRPFYFLMQTDNPELGPGGIRNAVSTP
jgi:hypothetical protein